MSASPRLLRVCLAGALLALPVVGIGVVVQVHADVAGQVDASRANRTPGRGASPGDPTAARTPAPRATATAPATSPQPTAPPDDRFDAKIATIRVVAARPHVPGYERGCSPAEACVFGPAWTDDVDVEDGHNGCDTRNDVLARDLQDVTYKPGTGQCVVLSGSFVEPYTGRSVDFVRGSNNIQIDHVVPLALAWDLGAAGWTAERRQDFANDPRNLLAVDGSANASKSDQGPGSWMPVSSDFRCAYVQKITDVAIAYDLTLPRVDVDSMLFTASTC